MSDRKHAFSTRLIHAGEPSPRPDGAVAMPVYQSSTWVQRAEDNEYGSVRYIRLNNLPNHTQLHAKLADLEEAEAALVTASGMAAISTAALSVLKAGDHLLAQDVLYGGTRSFFEHDLPELGIEVSFVGGDAREDWESQVRPNTRAVYVETLTNPLLHMADLKAVVATARDHNLISMIDNTMATPLYYQPITHGFDLSIHSCTKYLNGHSDVVAGAIVGSQELVDRCRNKLNHLGGSLDPHVCVLLQRGMRTLQLRVERQSDTAAKLATFLQEHIAVGRVYYPALASHPSHARASECLGGFGGLLSFGVADAAAAKMVIENLSLALHAPSFGGTETLITAPATSSHAGLSPSDRARQGIDDGLLRVAIGLEDADDLIEDFDRALAKI